LIALDDFGTGYSSLSYLRRFPFDKIKIDQTFVREQSGGGSRAENIAIVKAVANLAKSLRMATVAEGVETTDHLSRVAAAGVDQVQGYLISRPVPACAIVEAIHRASSLATLCRAPPQARANGA
jgi:EAL domain-containing protein (putative c-di-GMP-specific phosphodiesterase class I)